MNNNEATIFMDDSSWVWEFTKVALEKFGHPFIKTSSHMHIRQSWNRFHRAPFIIIHWEGKHRTGGAIVEEILEIAPHFDVSSRIIIITTNPVHEDVVHFSELGITRVIRPRLREKDLNHAIEEILQNLRQICGDDRSPHRDDIWLKVTTAIDCAPNNPPPAFINKITSIIKKLQDPTKKPIPKEIEALASLNMKTGELKEAESLLLKALDSNPNYFRGWNRLIEIRRRQGQHAEAYALLQKMQMQNRSSAKRLVAMGEVQLALKDHFKAESFFRSALDKDAWCSNALNGLAEVTFAQNHLDETRQLLSKSSLAYKFAVKLNAHGIDLARQERYDEALEHYSKAQYVLPQQEKSPQLFYNIALCYAKWGRPVMAKEFLELALIKEPNYKKAMRTLDGLKTTPDRALQEDLDVA